MSENRIFGYVYLTPIFPTPSLMETQPLWRLSHSIGETPNAYAIRDGAMIIVCKKHLPHNVHSRLRESARHLHGTAANVYCIHPRIIDALRELTSDENLQAMEEILSTAARPSKIRA